MSDASSNYSAVVEDILKLVWSAEEAGRDGVKPKDVSEHMGVVPSTATENIQRLARQGLVTHERYGRVRLTPQGRAIALGMVRRHRLLETYLHEALGFSWDEVHDIAGSPLDALDIAGGGIVVRLPDRDPEALRAWEEAGLVPGARITIVASDAGGVTVLLEDGQMLLLDPAQASGIVVRD